MSDSAATIQPDTSTGLTRQQLFAVVGLAVAQCLGSMGQIMMATLSAIVGATLAPTPQLATLPVTAGVLGIALATLPAARLIRRYGRRSVFAGVSLWGAAGVTIAAASIHVGSFVGFCLGCFAMGNNVAVVAQYRFAVAEIVPNALVSRAISGLMLATLLAAAAAPWAALHFRDLLPTEFSGSFAVLPLFYIAAALVIMVIPLGRPQTLEANPLDAPTLGQILMRPSVQLAIVSAAASYGVMSLIMTSTPISMHVIDQHSVAATAGVIRGHLLAMFAPSLISGWLIARLGISRMLWFGVLLNSVCIAFAVSGHDIWQYRYAMIALGFGWNLLFVAGTTLLATVCNRHEVLRVQGINDFVMFATMAVASLSAGALLDTIGWVWTNLAALLLLALVVTALLRARAAEPQQTHRL